MNEKFKKLLRKLGDLNCKNFAAPEDVRILTYPDIPDYRLENALLGETNMTLHTGAFPMLCFFMAPN